MRRPPSRRAPLLCLVPLVAAACGGGGAVKAPPVTLTPCGRTGAGDPVTIAAALVAAAGAAAGAPAGRAPLDSATVVALGRDVAGRYRDAIAVTVDVFADSAAVRCRAAGDTVPTAAALASYTFDRRNGDERAALAPAASAPAASAPAAATPAASTPAAPRDTTAAAARPAAR